MWPSLNLKFINLEQRLTPVAMFASSILFGLMYASRSGFASKPQQRVRGPATRRDPPVARVDPKIVYFGCNPLDEEEYRGDYAMDPPKARTDDYFWLRDETRSDKDVLDYIRSENEYCESETQHLKQLQSALYEEMLARLKETDEDVPYPFGDYEYYTRTVQGLSYPIYCRKALSKNANIDPKEVVVLDENILAEGQEYLSVSSIEPSPTHKLVAYSVDHTGYETYTLYVKNIATGILLEDKIEGTDGDIVWGNDDSTLFYMTMDDEHRPNKLFIHVLGTQQSEDVCLFQEDDGKFWMGVEKTASDRFLVMSVGGSETSEQHIIDLKGLVGGQAHMESARKLLCVSPRVFGVRYELEHMPSSSPATSSSEDVLLIVTNKDGAKNNKLVKVTLDGVGESNKWEDVVPYRADSIQIDSVYPFKDHLVIEGRESGLERIWVTSAKNLTKWRAIKFSEEAYSTSVGQNFVFNSNILRIGYSSLVTPKMTIDYNMDSEAMVVLKRQEVPSYDASLYQSKRIEITARDERKIPITLVYRSSLAPAANGRGMFKPFKPVPILLYAYGSYGVSMDPTFDYKRSVLLDRGIVFAIAHIRGGGEMGRQWYEDDGKYLTKLNTFNDFADCAQQLIDNGVTDAGKLAVVGRSAGGLLIGAVCNMYPHLFKAAVADVPFVDVLNTMSDPTIPLTVTEWEEWGNPNEEKYFEYMQKYSPYDNVCAQNYPSMLVTAGLNDPRVAYWEPAKWVAKLRRTKTDSNVLLLKTDMSSGHFSASDRYKYLKETAFEYAFILDQIGGDVSANTKK